MKNSFDAPKIARKMLTWEALVILIFVAPLATYAAFSVGITTRTDASLSTPGSAPAGGTVTVFITSGTTYTTPADYDDASAVWMAIGAGGNGGIAAGSGHGTGGGGGEYRQRDAPGLSANTTYDINIPSAGAGSGASGAYVKNGAGGGGTIFLEAKNGSVGQDNGSASGGAGGTGGTGTTAHFDGGAGGARGDQFGGGSGGGGAAGPTGAGKAGGDPVGSGGSDGAAGGGGGANGGSSTVGANGSGDTGGNGGDGTGGTGHGVGGTTGVAGTNGTAATGSGGGGGGRGAGGGNGSIDTAFDATHGAGGGGGGNTYASGVASGNGGTYGGGGAGNAYGGSGIGTGGQGIIVLRYTATGGTGADGLLLHYTFDGLDMVSNVADKSGNGAKGYLQGFTSTTTVPGALGGALSFNGTAGYVSEPTSVAGVKTVAFWAKASTTAANAMGLFNLTGSTVYASTSASKVISATGFTSPIYYIDGVASSTPGLYDANWHHIVITSTAAITGSQIEVGRANGRLLGGSIDDFRLYNIILTRAQAARLYGLGATTHIGVTPKSGLAAVASASGVSNGLVGWWTFDGSDLIQNAVDKSGNNNTGRLINFTSTTTVPGPIGQALTFDGSPTSANYVNVGNATSLNPSAITVSAWVKANALNNQYSTIYAKTSGAYHQFFVKSDGTLAAYVHADAGVFYDGTGANTLVTGKWYHLVFTYNSTAGLIGYVNGTVDKSVAANGPLLDNSSGFATIGEDIFNGGRGFNGSIDDVRVYNRALSGNEVQKLYGIGATTHVATTPTTGLAAPKLASGASNSLVGWWTFDGPDLLQNAVDKSGNGNKGLLAGFTSTTTIPGKLGQALTFDGVDDGINVVSIPELNPYTTSVWFKLNALPGASEWDITSKVGDVRNFGVLNDKLVVWDGTTGKFGATTLRTGVWYHGVVVHTGAQITVYLNGTADGAATASTPAQDGPGAFAIGHQASAARNFNGVLDDLRVYTRALSALEVQKLYDAGR